MKVGGIVCLSGLFLCHIFSLLLLFGDMISVMDEVFLDDLDLDTMKYVETSLSITVEIQRSMPTSFNLKSEVFIGSNEELAQRGLIL